MIFNDDSMLDFRGTGFGDSVMDSIFGYDAGEVVITGRVPGALYVDDFSEGEYGLQHIQPLEYIQNELGSVITVDIVDVADTSGILEETLVAEAPPANQPANDDDAPAALVALSHGKTEEPLVLIPGDSHGDAGAGDLNLTAIDLHDLAIPPIPLPSFEAPHITVTAPTFDDDTGPVIIGGRAYQSLSFLILDTPFVVGDSQLPSFLRPSLNELLGLPATDEDEGQAFVLPARSWLLH
ncbi:MAG: hypothetical protein JWR84_3457 [Caulobacter sp.]|nr:hypothetical protein [Caulobacter sp.]